MLAAQSIDYALVQVACSNGTGVALNVVSGLAFLFSVVASGLAYGRWRHACRQHAASGGPHDARTAFFASMAMLVGALSSLVQLMMWFPQWLISPCR